MDLATYRARISTPIPGDNPVGEKLQEDSQLDFIESQMIKVGSLTHAEVQWATTEEYALDLLEHKTKDIKLLARLLQCLQYQPSAPRFILSIQIFADFISAYWENCYPAPGKRGSASRKKFFVQILQRTIKAADNVEIPGFDEGLIEAAEQAVTQLQSTAEQHGLPVDEIDHIRLALKRRHASTATDNQGVTDLGSATTSTSRISTAALAIDHSNDRSIRHSLLKVADSIAEMADGQLMAIRLRRYATWFSITAMPEANADGETQLMPVVSADRISDYEEHLSRGADLSVWHKVEQSITVAPYWLDGHYLSFRIASQLDQPAWAQAIKEELRMFVQRFPQLLRLHFKGGIAFASDKTRQWLADHQHSPSSTDISATWNERRNEALSLAEQQGLPVALAMIDNALAGASEPRDRFYWRLLSADVMQQLQLSALANQQYQILLQQTQDTALAQWEPSLIQRLQQLIEQHPAKGI